MTRPQPLSPSINRQRQPPDFSDFNGALAASEFPKCFVIRVEGAGRGCPAPPYGAVAGRGTILVMLLLLVVSMLIGWFIGGPDGESRRVLATSTGMRSIVVVLYVARYCFPGTNVYMIPIVYLSLMVPINLLFPQWSLQNRPYGMARNIMPSSYLALS